MNESTYLKFSLHPSFLTNFNCPTKTEIRFLVILRKTFSNLTKSLKIIASKQDYFKSKNPSAYKDLTVEFLPTDEQELQRGTRYEICPGIQDISSVKLKGELYELGIQDSDLQNFILQLILQTRVGIQWRLISAFNSITMGLANKPKQCLISVTSPLGEDKGRELNIEYNKFLRKTKLIYKAPMWYGDSRPSLEPIVIGEIELILSISNDFEIKIETLHGLVKPFKEIKKLPEEEHVADFADVLNNLYNQLLELTFQPKNSQELFEPRLKIQSDTISHTKIRTSAFKRFWNWIKDSMQTLLIGMSTEKRRPSFSNPTSLHPSKNYDVLTSTSKFQARLSQSSEYEPLLDINYPNKHSERRIEEFVIFPSGDITHKKALSMKEVEIKKVAPQERTPLLSHHYRAKETTRSQLRNIHTSPDLQTDTSQKINIFQI